MHDLTQKLYSEWINRLWNGELELANALVSEDFVIHQARSGDEESEAERGPDTLRNLIERSHAPFSQIGFEIVVGPLVDGEMVAGRWRCRAFYAGGIPGATAKPGTEVVFEGTDILRVREGRFCEYWVSSDGLSLMEQLGAFG